MYVLYDDTFDVLWELDTYLHFHLHLHLHLDKTSTRLAVDRTILIACDRQAFSAPAPSGIIKVWIATPPACVRSGLMPAAVR